MTEVLTEVSAEPEVIDWDKALEQVTLFIFNLEARSMNSLVTKTVRWR